MSTVNGFQVGSETLKYNYESLDNYNTPNFSTSSSTTYVVGDYVMYNGKLYKCTTATTGGIWVSNNWAEAVLSDDVNDLNRQISDVEGALSDVEGVIRADYSITNGTIDNLVDATAIELSNKQRQSLTWQSGAMDVNGNIIQESLIYSSKISVSAGDSIQLRKISDDVRVIQAAYLCAFNGNAVVPEKGKNSWFNFPYVVPYGVDGVVVTISSAYSSGTPYADITKAVREFEASGFLPKYYPYLNKNSKRDLTRGIIGLWVKNVQEGAKYYLTEFRYNQVVGSATVTTIVVKQVLNGNSSDFALVVKGNGVYTPEKQIEYFENSNLKICIDWGRSVSGSGYEVSVSDDYELNPITLKESNVFPIAINNDPTIEKITVATQIVETHTVEKQVIESQIDVVSSARNAANYGVLPSNDGTTNYNNFQTLLDNGGTIVVDVPGIYEINGMLKIGSDTELIFGKQVVIKMMNSYGGFIVNKGASTNTYNENIRIYGLHLDCNGTTGGSGVYKYGTHGKIAFCFVKNLILDGIYVEAFTNDQYFIHIGAYENVTIQNCHIEGSKDGIHSACGEWLTIRNCYFKTQDDPIALNCQDYVPSVPYYGWIRNVLIENCVDDSPDGAGGAARARTILIYGGAWTDWASGNYYRNGDTVVSTNNKVYRFVSNTAISDATAVQSTVAPTASSGTETTSDGLEWRFVQDETVYNVACENITIRNIDVKCRRYAPVVIYNDDSRYCRSIYPSVIMPPHKNITIDGMVIKEGKEAGYCVLSENPVDTLKLINCKVIAEEVVGKIGSYTILQGNNDVTNISIVCCEFKRASGTLELILSIKPDSIINVKAYGNFKNNTMSNRIISGTVNMIANDLF